MPLFIPIPDLFVIGGWEGGLLAPSVINTLRMDIQDLLDEIENELTQEFKVNDQSRNRARQAVERSLTLSTPVRRFYERYRDKNNEKRQELFDDWRLIILNRAKNDPGAKIIRRRFMQYLRLGANYRSTAARTAARQGSISIWGVFVKSNIC